MDWKDGGAGVETVMATNKSNKINIRVTGVTWRDIEISVEEEPDSQEML